MRILVIGAGSVGGYFGARLFMAGEDVSFVARGAHAEALRTRGLLVRMPGEELRSPPLPVVALDDARGLFDLILLAVKWPSLGDVCARLPSLLAHDGLCAPLLNGLDSEEVVASFVGESRVVASIAYMSAGLTGPGEMYSNGATSAGFAPYRAEQAPRIEALAALLERAGIPTRRAADYKRMLWEKMVWNAPFNAICALSNKNAGVVVAQLEDIVREAMREVVAVAHAEGVTLSDDIIESMLKLTHAQFSLTEPSMLQDVRAGRETEVEILQGAVVARARRAGVEVPVLRTLEGLVRCLSSKPR